MSGIDLTVNTGADVRNATFNDEQVSGGSGATFTQAGVMNDCTIVLAVANANVQGPTSRTALTVSTLTLTTGSQGALLDCDIIADGVIVDNDEARLHGGEYILSPTTDEGGGIVVTGDSFNITDLTIKASLLAADDTFDAVSITGGYGVVDGLVFKKTSSNAWQYLIGSTGSTGTTVGAYATTTGAWVSGETNP